MANPIAYDVRYAGEVLIINLIGSDGTVLPKREEEVPLRCALGRDGSGGFAGRCADASGKWARFTMRPPE